MKKKFNLYKKVDGFNLQEILVVLVIIGILLLLALPNLMPLISKTKSLEAQVQLKHIYALEKQYFYMHSRYTNNLLDIGFESPVTVENNGKSNYNYVVEQVSNNKFVAKAIAVTDFDGDGVFNVWEINEQERITELVKD